MRYAQDIHKPITVLFNGLVVFACAAFLIVSFDRLHHHHDEELSYRATEGTIIEVVNYQIALQDNQAPLWFILFRAWRTLAGDSEFAARAFGVMLTLPALALIARLGMSAFGGWGIFAGAVLIGNGFFLQYALDIRMYPLTMLTAAWSTWSLWAWLRRRTVRHALVYGVSAALMLYTHYLLVFLIAAHAVYAAFHLPAQHGRARQTLRELLAAGAGAALWLPWLPVMLAQIQHLRRVEAAAGTVRGAAGIGVSTLATTPDAIAGHLAAATSGLAPALFVLWAVGVLLLARRSVRGRRGALLALGWAVVVPAAVFTANVFLAVYAPRFIAHTVLGAALLTAGSLAALPIARGLRGALLIGIIGCNLLSLPDALPSRIIPYRDLFAEVNALARAGDVLLAADVRDTDGFGWWQMQRWLSPALLETLTTDPTQARAAAASAGRIWFLTSDWFGESVRAVFDALEPHYPVRHVVGECDRQWCYLIQLMGDGEAGAARDA